MVGRQAERSRARCLAGDYGNCIGAEGEIPKSARCGGEHRSTPHDELELASTADENRAERRPPRGYR